MTDQTKPSLIVKKSGVILAKPHDTIEFCLETMANANIGSLLVVENNQIKGILTERDVLKHWRSLSDQKFRANTVATIMSQPVFSMKATELATAPREMVERKIRHIPLTDDQGGIVGIISMRDVLQAQVRARAVPRLRAVSKKAESEATVEPTASTASVTAATATAPAKAGSVGFIHVLSPHPQLIEICRQALPENWHMRLWTDINALQNAPAVKDKEQRERTAFVIDLDGFVNEDWKKLIRRFIEFLRSDKQPEVFLIWSPQLIKEADVASLQAIAEKARWNAYHRPLPVSAFTADIKELGDGSLEEEEED